MLNPEEMEEEGSREIKMSGTVADSVVVSGNHNTIHVNTSSKLESGPDGSPPSLPVSNMPGKLYAEWVGREVETESILASLRNPAGKKLLGIHGLGGIGKSALMREISERIQAERLFAAIWWTTAKQESLDLFDDISPDRIVSYETIINRLASWLGVSMSLREKNLAEREAAVRHILLKFPALLLLDNLETAAGQDVIAQKIGRLVEKTPARVILTSREAWNIPSVVFEPFALKGLAEAESVRLMRLWARNLKAAHLMTADETLLRQAAKSVGYMPLALKLVVGLLQNFDLATTLNDLEHVGSQKISGMYDYLFANSWLSLTDDEKDLLIAISTYAESEGIRAKLLRESRVVPEARFVDALDTLVNKSLVEVSHQITDVYYTLHPLTMNFIRAQLQ